MRPTDPTTFECPACGGLFTDFVKHFDEEDPYRQSCREIYRSPYGSAADIAALIPYD